MPLLMRSSTLSNWALLASGPIFVPFVNGSPTWVSWAVCFAIADTSAIRDLGTNMRVGALQDWPVLRKHACTPSFTALVKSASSKIILADLPPSSCVTRLTVGADAVATATPARGGPVHENIAT